MIGGDGQPKRHGRRIGPQAPPLTTTINKILQRYPEGGQILKVHHTLVVRISGHISNDAAFIDQQWTDIVLVWPRSINSRDINRF